MSLERREYSRCKKSEATKN